MMPDWIVHDLLIGSMLFTLLPVLLYLRNVRAFRVPPTTTDTFAISVLIPARNEEASIAACVNAVLGNIRVDLEVIVLDDASTDRTAEIVREIATRDSRVRLESSPALPEGWSGKQHACFALSKIATKPLLCFLDADVRLSPDALCRLAAFQRQSKAALVSGFPRQETGTILEKLLIPLIHFVLLSYLSVRVMRQTTNSRFGAGCGQLFLTTRESYDHVGGHDAVRSSFHDGVKLPRAYRAMGLMTDICDATPLATCRMYRTGHEVWNGLAKNAREGLGGPIGLWVWTVILLMGQVLPWLLGFVVYRDLSQDLFVEPQTPMTTVRERWCILAMMLVPLVIRLHAACRYRQSWLSAFLHPSGVLLLLGIQWYAAIRHWIRSPIGWKGRIQPDSHTSTEAVSTQRSSLGREEFQS